MIDKYAIWQKTKQNSYMLTEYSDASMFVLDFFLGDGLEPEHYIDFLENKNEQKLPCNISSMQKHNGMVTVVLHDSDLLGLSDFTTTINNLLKILKQWYYYQEHLVDVIKISLKGNDLTIVGAQKNKITYNNQKIVFTLSADSPRYGLASCEGETSYLLAHFLCSLWPKDIDHYIQWALNPDENYVIINFSTLEKKDGFILIGLKLGDKDTGAQYKLSIENFVELLKKWQSFNEKKEPEIVVYEENNYINIKRVE